METLGFSVQGVLGFRDFGVWVWSFRAILEAVVVDGKWWTGDHRMRVRPG